MLDLFSAVHNLVVEYLTEVYERARLAHNSSNPADAKVVKPLTNLTEVLQVRFLGQNLSPKLKEVGLDCDSLTASGKERARANSQPSHKPSASTTTSSTN